MLSLKHPGTVLGEKQYAFLKTCKDAAVLKQLQNATSKWNVKGVRALMCVNIGPHGSGSGHEEFTGDAMQCYRFVLLWLLGAQVDGATYAANILKSWCTVCTKFEGANAPLECAWGSAALVRSAEILKYKWSGWTSLHEAQIHTFLDKIVLPNLKNRYKEIYLWKNNWILTILEALIQIAIFKNNVADFKWALSEYRKIAPLTFTTPFTGRNTEITRDLIHAQFQLDSHIQIAEMCFHQGIKDLYNDKLRSSMEYTAAILTGGGKHKPTDLSEKECATLNMIWVMPGAWEIGYNHYANRQKVAMPHTAKLVAPRHPEDMSFNWGPGWTHKNTY